MSHGIPLTPELMRAAYELLCLTPPFNRWKMPPSEEVKFEVMKDPALDGYCLDGKICLSSRSISQLTTMLPNLSHEMVHLYQQAKGLDTRGVVHNADFNRRLALVCKRHGFDPKAAR